MKVSLCVSLSGENVNVDFKLMQNQFSVENGTLDIDKYFNDPLGTLVVMPASIIHF